VNGLMFEEERPCSRESRKGGFWAVFRTRDAEREIWRGRGVRRDECTRLWLLIEAEVEDEVMRWVRVVSSVAEGYPRVHQLGAYPESRSRLGVRGGSGGGGRYTQGRYGLASCHLCEVFAGFCQSGGLGRHECSCGRMLRRANGRFEGARGEGEKLGEVAVTWLWCRCYRRTSACALSSGTHTLSGYCASCFAFCRNSGGGSLLPRRSVGWSRIPSSQRAPWSGDERQIAVLESSSSR